MSGGSYDYAGLISDLEDLSNKYIKLQQLADDLSALGYAKDAARETVELLVAYRQWSILTEVICKRLGDVWCAFEWWQSNDYSEQQFKNALKEYRKPKGILLEGE